MDCFRVQINFWFLWPVRHPGNTCLIREAAAFSLAAQPE